MRTNPCTRQINLVANFAAILCILILTACAGENAPDPHQLISKSQVAIQNVKSYHFNLATTNPGTGGGLVITNADGDIVVPDKLKADANVVAFGSTLQVQLISVGGKQYLVDKTTGKVQTVTGQLDPTALSNSQTGVASILGQLQNLSTPTDDTVDGTPCWNTSGKLDTKYLQAITNGGTPTATAVDVTICIGKTDNLPYLIRVTGPAVQGDLSNTVRTFKLSKFNESVTITAPHV